MTPPTNTTPPWKSYMATGNTADIVASTTVATAIGTKVDADGGQIGATTVLLPTLPSSSAGVTVGNILADEHLLRAYGAAFDGTTDDGPAFNAIIAAATSLAPNLVNGLPTICFDLPMQTTYINTPIQSGSVNVSIRGTGAQNSVILLGPSSKGWNHGTASSLSAGYFQAENVMFQDKTSSGSGFVALSCYFARSVLPTFRLNTVRFLHFTQGLYLFNPPRDINCYAITVYGPDYAVQSNAGIIIQSTQTTGTVFTTSWIMCNVFNYQYGWQFLGNGMIEGHRFYGSTCYNGWGMVQAYVKADGIDGVTDYQAVIWDFYSCDWQGYGYALDMHNVRGVRVRGGFYTLNARTTDTGTSITPPWGSRTSAATCAMFDFYGSSDILFDGVQIDVSNSDASDTVIAHFDDSSSGVRIKENAIYATVTMYGGFELGDPNASSVANNVMRVMFNEWIGWVSGDKVIDHAGKQIDLPWVEDNYYGTQSESGMFTIQQQTQVTLESVEVSSTDTTTIAQAYVKFPTRRYGTNLFKGGVPTVVAVIQQALISSSPAAWLGASDQAGFYVNAPSSNVGVEVTVNYIATGW